MSQTSAALRDRIRRRTRPSTRPLLGYFLDRLRSVEDLRTPVRAPHANACCEHFLRSVRAKCLDHVLIRSEDHLGSVLRHYCAYFNRGWPYQGIARKVPDGSPASPHAGGVVAEIHPVPAGECRIGADCRLT